MSTPYATWQYGLDGVTAEPFSPAPNALVPVVVVASSGSRARTSQLSATVWPVLVPPTSVKRAAEPHVDGHVDAVEVTATTRRTGASRSTRLSTCPAFSGTTS